MEVAGIKIVHYHFDKEKQATFPKEPIWFDARYPVKSFSGRDDELKHLHYALQSKGGQAVVSQMTSISGLGGIGKSELARKYAYDYKKYYGDNVVWINAETQESIRKSFQGLATKKLRIPITEKKDDKEQERDIKSIVEDVYKYFRNAESLFIFDNAEQYESIYEFLPSYFYLHCNDKKPHVLITSRNRDWKVEEEEGEIKVIQLGILTPENAVQFISKALELEDKKDDLQETEIKQLAKQLQYFPLALRQAISYIKEKKEDFELRGDKFEISDYLKEYENEAEKLLHFESKNDRYTKTTFITWKITIENIKQNEHGQGALNVLEIMAYFAPDNVPIKTFFSEPVVDEKSLWDAIKLLNQYSMINVEKGVSSIHRLVQHVIRLGLQNESKEEEILEKALKLINSAKLAKNNSSHITSVWNYASKYGKLIDKFYFNSFYGRDKKTPLHLLAENGHSKAIEAILTHIGKNGLNEMRKIIYTPDSWGSTPFQTAINNGYLDIIKVFVEKGADVKAANRGGNTPLHWAAGNGHLIVVKYLVEEKGADVKAANKDGSTPLHLSARYGHLDVVKYLVAEKGADVKAANNGGNTPLHWAAEEGRLDVVKYLVEEKGADVKATDKDGNTPLRWAARYGHLDVVKYLVEEKGADVKAANKDGSTPLHWAAIYGYWDVVKYLVEEKGADVKASANNGNTPLHWAARNGRLDVVKYLVEEKGADVKAADNGGNTSLHWAAGEGRWDVVKYLVEEKDADVKATNKDGDTPLRWAAGKGNLDVVKYLVEEKGADIKAANKDGSTPLHWAAIYGCWDVVKYLVEEKGADVKVAANDGNTSLHWAAEEGRLDVVKYLVEEKGADIKATDKDGNTPLHWAAEEDRWGLVKYLVEEKGADVKAAANDGNTPLHWAARNGRLDVVKYLVEEKGADVKAAANDGNTPLHWAARNGHLDVVKYLVEEKGADVKAANNDGSTPLHLAAENRHWDVVKYLEQRTKRTRDQDQGNNEQRTKRTKKLV
jgi:ankyrin repeat protein